MVTAEDIREDDPNRPIQKPWTPRVIRGGKGPPEPPKDDWLLKLEAGTTFVTRPKSSQEVDLNLYHLLFQGDGFTLLKWEMPDGKLWDYYVDPVRFSTKFIPGIILGIFKGDPNGDSNRTDRPRDVVLDETMQGEHQLVEEAEQPDL